jgi:hypothetical protein
MSTFTHDAGARWKSYVSTTLPMKLSHPLGKPNPWQKRRRVGERTASGSPMSPYVRPPDEGRKAEAEGRPPVYQGK